MPSTPAPDDDVLRSAADQADLQRAVAALARTPQSTPQAARGVAHGQPLGAGWSAMLGRAGQDLALAPRLKALAQCAVATLNGADQGMHHHGPLLLRAGGSSAQLAALCRLPTLAGAGQAPWTPLEHATLTLCVQMTGAGKVTDAAFDGARLALDNDELLFELISVIGTQHMVTRVLASTGSGICN